MSKSDTCINNRFKFKTAKLTKINEVIYYYIELKSFSDNFLNKFTHSIKKNN